MKVTRTCSDVVCVAASLWLLCAFSWSCGSKKPPSDLKKERDYKTGKYEQAPKPVSDGSLWQNSSRGLFADFRASRVGDLVSIRISETAKASGDAGTDMDRNVSESFGAPKLLGLMSAIQNFYPDLDPDELYTLIGRSSFQTDGDTERGTKMRGDIAVRVKKELPNQDLFVEGTKMVQINDERLYIYVSGVIRPQDIRQDNTVASSLIADAEVRFRGFGPLTDNQRPGWLARLLAKIRPM